MRAVEAGGSSGFVAKPPVGTAETVHPMMTLYWQFVSGLKVRKAQVAAEVVRVEAGIAIAIMGIGREL